MSDRPATAVEHLDVLIVGAGVSGIGAAHYLKRDEPSLTYAILEARADLGGTWDLNDIRPAVHMEEEIDHE